MYFLIPETKGHTLEETGHLFGDDVHVAHFWYGASEEEKAKIERQALEDTKGLGCEGEECSGYGRQRNHHAERKCCPGVSCRHFYVELTLCEALAR